MILTMITGYTVFCFCPWHYCSILSINLIYFISIKLTLFSHHHLMNMKIYIQYSEIYRFITHSAYELSTCFVFSNFSYLFSLCNLKTYLLKKYEGISFINWLIICICVVFSQRYQSELMLLDFAITNKHMICKRQKYQMSLNHVLLFSRYRFEIPIKMIKLNYIFLYASSLLASIGSRKKQTFIIIPFTFYIEKK